MDKVFAKKGSPSPVKVSSSGKSSLASRESAAYAAVRMDRDLGWLDFNRRVLMLAEDASVPLFERLNYLAIFGSNLDEFFMKRVMPLRREIEGISGLVTPREGAESTIFHQVRAKVIELGALQDQMFQQKIVRDLAQIGVFILQDHDLTNRERSLCERLFVERVFPALTPLAVDAGHPFPFISNNSQSLGVILQLPRNQEKIFARVKIPAVLPGFLCLSPRIAHEFRMISINQLIAMHVDRLFEGMRILRMMPFRVIRNADVEIDEDEADDLLEVIEEGIKLRRFEQVVRLQYSGRSVPWLMDLLEEQLEVTSEDIYQTHGLMDYTALKSIIDLPVSPPQRFPKWQPRPCQDLEHVERDIFSAIKAEDILVHHPYESFTSSVERFVTEAAVDPQVVAIKMTLYRIAPDSPFIPAIIKAVELGKQVVVIIEIKARFDEQRNIELVRRLEEAGVHVVYGVHGFKTHAKVTLVVRNEEDGFRCYCHIGTGNYHMLTAKLYTDFSLFTCRKAIADEVVPFFHYLTGKSLKCIYKRLLVAPINMKQKFLELIAGEIANKELHKPARIIAKMNAFDDEEIGRALVHASQKGVDITLFIRGFCCLRAGVAGMTDNIKIFSHLGRFLEHSRLFYFAQGSRQPGAGKFLIGSADWMHRNLDARVELVVEVENHEHKLRLHDILEIMLHDKQQAWQMLADGTYVFCGGRSRVRGGAAKGTHEILMHTEGSSDVTPQSMVAPARWRTPLAAIKV